MIQFTGIDYTAYPVTDLPRARGFYEGVLGLKPGATFGEGAQQWIEYDLGPATLVISNMSPEMWKPSSDGPSVALGVADFPAAIATLKAAQARFIVEPMDSGVCSMAIVSDPDGNSLIIHRRNSS